MADKIEKTVHVAVPPETAFRIFSERLDTWWPVESHSLSAQDGARPRAVTVDPRLGGAILETKPDGSTAPWAVITEWTPNEKIALDWFVGRDPSEATQVEILFLPEETGTRVILTHDGFDRLGAAADTMRLGYHTGWDLVLGARFTAACAARAA